MKTLLLLAAAVGVVYYLNKNKQPENVNQPLKTKWQARQRKNVSSAGATIPQVV